MATQRYTIQTGDTLHQIARRLMGHADQWIVLAEFNKLDWPYVDTTGATYAGKKVLVVGDTLLVPSGLAGGELQRAEQADPNEIYMVLLGVDMALSKTGDLEANTSTKDWKTKDGIANLQQALRHRLLTRKGELAYHPNYGSNIEAHIGHPLDETRVSLVRLEVIETLLSDPRLRSVPIVDVVHDGDQLSINAQCEVIGVDDVVPLNLVITT
jgi:phage baseplate assembly protein W